MPRKSSRAVKKDAASESKSEGGAPRRSGRAVTKVETTPSSGKEASRSRRSSTAAQTAASVADSKTPKGRTSSRRGSVSPSDGRSRSSVESPATRVKSTRRSTGRINYKESDGEEEVATPKYDENFDSGEEFEESDSDENSKSKGRNRSSKIITKSPTPKEKPRGSSGRKGKTTKKKSDDDNEAEASDDIETIEIENTPSNKNVKQTPAKGEESKEAPKSARGRRAKAETVESKTVLDEKPKPSRRSARSSSNKEETQKKRPSRSVQAKKYTEEEEEEIEEIDDSKADDDEVKAISSQKRKRSTSTEPNKRIKKDVSENESKESSSEKNIEDMKDESITKTENENNKATEEPMEVDESESVVPEKSEKSADSDESCDESAKKSDSVDTENIEEKESKENISKEKLTVSETQKNMDGLKHAEENMHDSDSERESQIDHSVSSEMEDSQDVKENKNESAAGSKTLDEVNTKHHEMELSSQSSESCQQIDENSEESKEVHLSAACSEQQQEKIQKENEKDVDLKCKDEKVTHDNSVMEENKPASVATSVLSSTSQASIVHSKQSSNAELTVNGPDNNSSISNTTPVIHTNSNIKFESSENLPRNENGEHDLHSNSILPQKDQYYLLPGRRYVVNSKLSENMRQSLKDKTFGFVSWSLGPSNADVCLQKDKLLNELKCLDAHIICLQQVSRPFYNSALEPSLHAHGFKGVFSQPNDSLKGMATFYKASFFKLNKYCETSFKHLLEKELEASSLDSNDRAAVRAHVKRCGNMLLTNFSTLSDEEDAITVANVQIPSMDLSVQALQVSCLGQEVFRINGGVNRPLLISGEFNMKESEAPYQLLRDGYLSNEMIEELNRKKDVVLPGKENASMINLLWKSYQHPSSNLSSCYKVVLDHEVFIPEKKVTSPDLLWYSSDCLHTIGVLDLISDKLTDDIISDKLTDHPLSLKADIAFSP